MSSVLIGAGRRITLEELGEVCSGSATLEWHVTGDNDEQELPAPSLTLSKEPTDDSLLSTETSRAVLTLLALNLSQGKLIPKNKKNVLLQTLSNLFQLVNDGSNNNHRLSSDASTLAEELGLSDLIPLTVVQRTLRLGVGAWASQTARGLSDPVSVVVASLTAESTRANTSAYSEALLDMARPHRGLVSVASALRSILNGSKYATPSSKADTSTLEAIATIPQYVGPALDVMKVCCKTMELECNCFEPNPSIVLDETVVNLTLQQGLEATLTLLHGCYKRQQVDVPSPAPTTLEDAVVALERALEEEAKTAVGSLKGEQARVEKETAKKEAAKQNAAANRPAAAKKENEFEGMTEAQKAKMLKKRAEKEAKAAKKRAAKQSKGQSLFGTGTMTLLKLLETNQFALSTSKVQDQLNQILDKLSSGGVQRKPKIPKGTRDYLPDQMRIRQQAFDIIRRVFQSHGAVEIDTPVFELKDTLTGKYGEDSKLIYDLADQGGELLALRYDLTVPFARFLALNSVGNIKRYHIGKVYRRDQPVLSRGRYREFYQCDFDIAGVYGRMIPDAECLSVVCDILGNLPIGDFGIKLNHRKLLDAILELSGVGPDKFRTICSAVDKLDKEEWSEVKREMVEDKGLKPEVADKIGTFVLQKGKPWEMYKSLMDSNKFGKHDGALAAMEDLRILFGYLEAMGKLDYISFDLSLARGLDYYTGVIYEAVCMSGTTQVGSIGGGGRYDNLVGMFQEGGKQTPCVGVSVGIERVFTLMEARLREEQGGSIKQPNVQILVASAGGNGMLQERMKIARMLWDANLSTEFTQQEAPKLKYELASALERGIPYVVIVGETEWAEDSVKVKDLNARTEETIKIADLVSVLRGDKGIVPVGCKFAFDLLKKEEQASEATSEE